MPDVITLNLGDRFALASIPQKYDQWYTILNNGHIENSYSDGYFYGPVITTTFNYVANQSGFGEAMAGYPVTGSFNHYLFVIRNADGSLPVQHSPLAPDVTVSFGSLGSGDMLKTVQASVSDPDGDTVRVYANSSAKSGSFAAALEGYAEPASYLNYSHGFTTFYVTDSPNGFLSTDYRGSFVFQYTAADAFGNEALGSLTVKFGDFSRQYIVGQSGNDVLDMNGKTAAFELDGGAGNDRLVGGAGSDLLYGNTGNDLISAGKGDDVLNGGAGGDRLSGGLGNDTFVLNRFEFGNKTTNLDHIIDFEGAGVSGGDTIRFTGFGAGATVTYLYDSVGIQRYQVTDGSFTAEFMVQTTNGKHLSAGDYLFM